MLRSLVAHKPSTTLSYQPTTLTTIATGLAAAMNANSGLTGVALSAVAATPASLITSQTFSASIGSENRLIQINYAGSGNNSQFTFDGYGHTVKIVETVSGSVTGTKQFIWSRDKMCEERNASGTLLSQFFRSGQTIDATNYFYTKDHLSSVRDLTDTYGVSQAHYDYTPFGQVTKTGSSIDAEFQFCGMYTHTPSQLNLAIYRAALSFHTSYR
jgi:hypothetical protein